MSYQTFTNSAAPATPASGKTSEYVDTTGRVVAVNSTGVSNQLSGKNSINFLRNSGFWFAQRQAPGTLTTYSNASNRLICADGWGLTCENASSQYVRTDTSGAAEAGLQSRFYGQFTKITSAGKIEVTQVIEGHDAQQLRGRTIRVQVWMRGLVAASQTVRLGLVNNTGTLDVPTAAMFSAQGANGTDPTLGASLAYIAPKAGVTPDNATVVGNAASCTVTNSATWQRYGAVFDVPTTAKNLIVVLWSDSQLAATNGFAVGQASLTDGYEIMDWAPLSYPVELARVQRFYSKTFNVDTLPATSVAALSGEHRFPSLSPHRLHLQSPVTGPFPCP